MSAPAGFHRRDARGGVAWIADAFLAELAAFELAEPAALARWLASAAEPVPGGRARGHRIGLARSGRAVHLRELAHGGILRRLTGRRFLGLGRGCASLVAAARLRERGVAVPAPVLLCAQRRGIFWHVEIGNEFVDGCTSGGRFLETADPPSRRAAAREAGRRLRAFHDAGGSHPDLHVDNLLVDPAAAPPAITITDLDGVRVGAPPTAARRMREIARLDRSLAKRGLPPAERRRLGAAFLGGYADRDRRLRRALLSYQRREALRNAVHGLGHRLARASASSQRGDGTGAPG